MLGGRTRLYRRFEVQLVMQKKKLCTRRRRFSSLRVPTYRPMSCVIMQVFEIEPRTSGSGQRWIAELVAATEDV